MTDQSYQIKLRLLLLLPPATYAISYLYLAWYHGQLWLFNTVIHEGGTYTLLQTIFYASHFLGHIPSLSVIALLFVGSVLTFQPAPVSRPFRTSLLLISLFSFLLFAVIVSVFVFGTEDTWAFVWQNRQAVGRDVQGGAWDLHLPSTITLIAALPLYIMVFAGNAGPRLRGFLPLSLAIVLIPVITLLANRGSLAPLAWVWTDPRYLGHSVRELATFPFTFFPIPLYLILRKTVSNPSNGKSSRRSAFILITILLAALLPLLAYQVITPVTHGIGALSQKPAFTHGDKLSILYLLTSHYFEHMLDTIYFTLFSLLVFNWFTFRSMRTAE